MSVIYNTSIHSDISEFPTEKRYDSSTKVSELKKKLELITGANHASMKVTLFIGEEEICTLDNDEETLGHYATLNNNHSSSIKLVVKDELSSNPLDGDVPKYTISEEKYTERKNNVRNFIKELREKRVSRE